MEKVNLDTLVDDIFFNVRIRSCLRQYYVKTLRQLVSISCIGILKMRDLDKNSRTVIEVWLEARGLHLEMTKEEIAEYEGVPTKAEEEQSAADTPEEHPMIKTEETPPPTEDEVLEKAVEEVFQNHDINLKQEVFWLAKEIFLYDMRKHGYSGHSAAECAASVAVRLYTEVNDKLKKLKE